MADTDIPATVVRVTKRDGDKAELEWADADLQAQLAKGPIILRGMLSEDECNHIRSFARAFARKVPETNPEVRFGSASFHRIDNNPPKSKVKSVLHGYAFFYWNAETAEIAPYFKRVMGIRNRLSGLPADYGIRGEDDGYISAPAVQQYPRGGGWMQEHIDPDIGQKVILSTLLSKRGADFQQGGLYYVGADGEKVWMDPHMNPGDTFLFHPAVRHGVAPVDADAPLDWDADDGRWMMFSALVSVSSLRGADDGTAGTATAPALSY